MLPELRRGVHVKLPNHWVTYVFTSLVSCFIEGDMNVQKYIFMLVVNSR